MTLIKKLSPPTVSGVLNYKRCFSVLPLERPVSEITCKFLDWSCQQLKRNGTKVLALVWDNASWHVSQQVRAWIRQHNQTVKSSGGVRILVCHLPVKSPQVLSH